MNKTITPTILVVTVLSVAAAWNWFLSSDSASFEAGKRESTKKLAAGFGGSGSQCSTCVGTCSCPLPNHDQQPCLIGVDGTSRPGEPLWKDRHPIVFQPYLHGEYIGPIRQTHVGEYRLRVGDSIQLVYR
jgi:hypothetical protein